jgi:hypothetical protein
LLFKQETAVRLKSLRILAILLAALAMGMHLAHAFELLPKRQWPPDLYLAVQSTLYKLFGIIGPVLEVGALIAVAILAFRVRLQPAVRLLTLVSAGAIVLALLTWGVFVLPANMHLAAWQTSGTAPPDWTRWRDQWQFAQASIFLLHLVGFTALVSSVAGEA